ncbi:MAG: hypothetical protein Q7S47_00425 [bacterium]|nr:hypothetical protein [bacterium]
MKEKLLHSKVVDHIKTRRIHMRPKWHFVLKALLAGLGGILLFLVTLYLGSFVFFMMQQTGVWEAPYFGLRGVHLFLTSLPWILIAVLALFWIVLEMLVRRYSFAYRQPLLYSVLGIFLFVVLLSYSVAVSPFHRAVSQISDRLPFAHQFYRDYGHPQFRNVHRGVIREVTQNGFILFTDRDEVLTVVVTPRTRMSRNLSFVVGDRLYVFGDVVGNHFEPFGIRKLDEQGGMRRERNMRVRMY